MIYGHLISLHRPKCAISEYFNAIINVPVELLDPLMSQWTIDRFGLVASSRPTFALVTSHSSKLIRVLRSTIKITERGEGRRLAPKNCVSGTPEDLHCCTASRSPIRHSDGCRGREGVAKAKRVSCSIKWVARGPRASCQPPSTSRITVCSLKLESLTTRCRN